MYGFISSHAANTACLAAFLMIGGIIRFKNASFIEKVIFVLLPMYVLLNAYSRVYLGVHYPSDVMAGIIFGALMGWGFSILHKILINRYADQTNLTD